MSQPLRAFPRLLATFAACLGAGAAETTFYSGRTEYILVDTPKTWDQAQADAVSRGGNLVKIEGVAENALILSKISGKISTTASDGGGTVYAWIGGRENGTEGTYQWADGTVYWTGGKTGAAAGTLYTNWGRTTQGASGPEPDNFAGSQNRAAMALGRWPSTAATDGAAIGVAGQWNDLNGSDLLPYVIEHPIGKPAEGIFATFTMTHGGRPMGSFTCQLFYDKAPKAVANFMSLAEGTRAWIDTTNGNIVSRSLYNGLKCHRIIPGFMIQGGDPLGTGAGGPGYKFVDEFNPDLRHDHLGVLSMANSGVATNGSQFFVTVSEPAHLNDVHTIFGHVVSGYETVVQPLSVVTTVTGDKPVEDVLIQSVTIERLGAAALAYDPLAQGLPTCEWQPVRLELGAGDTNLLKWTDPAHVSYQLFGSADLKTWKSQTFSFYSGQAGGEAESLDTVGFPASTDKNYFFHLARVVYQPFAPVTPPLKKLTLTGTTRGITSTLVFTSATGGDQTVIYPSQGVNQSSLLSNVAWNLTQFDTAAMTSDFSPTFSVFGQTVSHADWNLKFTTATKGTFTGGFYISDRSLYLSESGSFTVENLP